MHKQRVLAIDFPLEDEFMDLFRCNSFEEIPAEKTIYLIPFGLEIFASMLPDRFIDLNLPAYKARQLARFVWEFSKAAMEDLGEEFLRRFYRQMIKRFQHEVMYELVIASQAYPTENEQNEVVEKFKHMMETKDFELKDYLYVAPLLAQLIFELREALLNKADKGKRYVSLIAEDEQFCDLACLYENGAEEVVKTELLGLIEEELKKNYVENLDKFLLECAKSAPEIIVEDATDNQIKQLLN